LNINFKLEVIQKVVVQWFPRHANVETHLENGRVYPVPLEQLARIYTALSAK
jgi:hypothetical protein